MCAACFQAKPNDYNNEFPDSSEVCRLLINKSEQDLQTKLRTKFCPIIPDNFNVTAFLDFQTTGTMKNKQKVLLTILHELKLSQTTKQFIH